MSWELFLSIAAVFISAILGFITWLQNRKSNSLQERIVELEEQREIQRKHIENSAELLAKIEFSTSGYKDAIALIITNIGLAGAENVKIWVNDKPPSKVDNIYTEDRPDVLEVLPANDYVKYPFIRIEENQPPIEVKIKYDDSIGIGHERNFKLRL